MNKKACHILPGGFRVLIAVVVLALAGGPALTWAALAGPVCTSPCCASAAPEPVPHGHGHTASRTPALMVECCHASPYAACDLSRARAKAPSAAVFKVRAVSPAPHAGVGAVRPVPIDARSRSLMPGVESAAGPSSFPPLFLLKNTLRC